MTASQPSIDLLDLIGHDTTLKRAGHVGGRGTEYYGPCPFCGGKDRFRVQPDEGQWWCRQCSPNEHWQSAADYVMRRDNVTFAEAAKTLGIGNDKPRSEPDSWDYYDEHGALIYQVVRFTKDGHKSYYQRVPDGSGWKSGLNGTAPTIYRLPEVMQAAAKGETIYIAEGEKCADALRRIGLIATTNSGGAGKWRDAYSKYLAGAGDAVIVADNDEPGRKHAADVLRSVQAVVPSARIVGFSELPEKGDVADWLQTHTKDELLERCKPQPKAAPKSAQTELLSWHEQGITLRQLQSKVFDPEVWIIENILPEGACLFAAKYKSKKSWFSLALGCAVSMGGKALGRLDVAQGRVLYLDLEGKQQRIQKRTRAMLGVHHIAWPDNFHVFTKWPQGDKGMEQLADWLRQFPDTRLVIIDVLNDFRRPMEKHEQFYQYDRDTVQPINELLESYHAAGLLVHHFNKTKGNTDVFDSMTGSTGLPSAVNTMWAFERDTTDSNLTKFSMRGRDLEQDDPLALSWDDYLTQHVIEGPAAQVATSNERKSIITILDDDQPRTPKQIAEELSAPVANVKQLLRKLLDDGVIDKTGYGLYGLVRKRDHSDHSDHSGNGDHSDHSVGKSDRKVRRVIDPFSTDHSSVGQHNAVNGKSDRSDRINKGGDFVINRITAAGWVQEASDQGFRYVHPDFGETRWYKTPYLAMDEADQFNDAPTWDSNLEGYS